MTTQQGHVGNCYFLLNLILLYVTSSTWHKKFNFVIFQEEYKLLPVCVE